jgi:hypothetical protein
MRDGASYPALPRANELLGQYQYMTKATTVTIAGAAHFMISTHVARLIAQQHGRTENTSRSAPGPWD